jgi:hypothetical protein
MGMAPSSCPILENSITSCLLEKTRSYIHKIKNPLKSRIQMDVCSCPLTNVGRQEFISIKDKNDRFSENSSISLNEK